MSEELKQAIEAAKVELEKWMKPFYGDPEEDEAEFKIHMNCLISRKHMKAILDAIPSPETVAIFPAPIDLAQLPALNKALKQAFGPGLLVEPYAGGGFQVTKRNNPTQ